MWYYFVINEIAAFITPASNAPKTKKANIPTANFQIFAERMCISVMLFFNVWLFFMQLENQDSVRTLLKRTEAELNVRVTDALRKQEDPLQRQRLLVEEERLKYLNEEELIIQQLQSVTVHDLFLGSV